MNIECPHCGKEAPGGRVLCPSCGAKLHTAPAKKSTPQRAASGLLKGLAQLIRGLIRLCITVVIVGLIGLIFWPVAPQGAVGAAGEGERVRAALTYIEKAKEQSKPTNVTLSETQLNSYFSEQVSVTGTSAGGVQLESINIDLFKTHAVFNVGTSIGPVKLSWDLSLVPAEGNHGLPFDIVKARIGHLPMLGGLKQFAGNKVAGLFADFDKEQESLKSVKQIKLTDGGVLMSVSK